MNLTLQFVPFNEINSLAPEKKINRLLDIVKKDKIVLLQGRLKPSEETWLIQKTMEQVTREFKGIELCTIYPGSKKRKNVCSDERACCKITNGFKGRAYNHRLCKCN